jgi:hypothetical protein
LRIGSIEVLEKFGVAAEVDEFHGIVFGGLRRRDRQNHREIFVGIELHLVDHTLIDTV